MREASEVGGDLTVAAARPKVRSMFELVRLHHVVDVFSDCEEALRSTGVTLGSSGNLGGAQ
jgi:hypothetical protein